MIVDFHTHTLHSDGTQAPAELLRKLDARGVERFAITDHDALEAYAALDLGSLGDRVIVGVEINTTYRRNEVHVLGYGFPLDSPVLRPVLERNADERERRVRIMAEQLTAAGYDVSFEDIRAESTPGSPLGRPHVARALIRRGHTDSIEGAFRSLLRRGGPGYVPSTYMDPRDAVRLIRESGGVAVLAHPGRLDDYAIIGELANEGLQGLEVFYPTHSSAQRAHFRELAQRHGLVMTGGSDFHDQRYNKGGVGMEVAPRDLEGFFQLLG
ncbi:MAG TPA: PHP domain-containing protein [Candidatus Dormibacteraeota bacterium]|nr:PHP domain-containing protein [Candidatus Dormibacteraeota bacterium]